MPAKQKKDDPFSMAAFWCNKCQSQLTDVRGLTFYNNHGGTTMLQIKNIYKGFKTMQTMCVGLRFVNHYSVDEFLLLLLGPTWY